MNILCFIRKEYRLHDNPALYQASLDGNVCIVTLPVLSGQAAFYFANEHLKDFQQNVKKLGGTVYTTEKNASNSLHELFPKLNVDAVYINAGHSKIERQDDDALKKSCDEKGIAFRSFEATTLYELHDLSKKDGTPYQVYSPFYKFVRTIPVPAARKKVQNVSFMSIEEHQLPSCIHSTISFPQAPAWYKKMKTSWEIGEDAAIERVKTFVDEEISAYKKNRDVLYVDGTSRISPYLAIGALSIRSVWHYVSQKAPDVAEPFLRQLIWREFSYYTLLHYPDMKTKTIKKSFRHFPSIDNELFVDSWKKGKTGIPLVDAGMRELWETGYMHNRVRMNVASYLTKHLLQPFQIGEEWFWDTLLDADIANNPFSWQWVAGSGLDAAPYFRIFNPYLQSIKFDESSAYIRKWIPELAKLPDEWVYRPHEAPKDVLEHAGVIIGTTYPFPIISHETGRKRALLAYEEMKMN